MGNDKKTKNKKGKVVASDGKKGADIFNNVKGMIDKIIIQLNTHKDVLTNDIEIRQSQIPVLQLFAIVKTKIGLLEKTYVHHFNLGRENKDWRTAKAGEGNEFNDKLFSIFQSEVLSFVTEIFESSVVDTKKILIGKQKAYYELTKLLKIEYVKKRTIDFKAYEHRKNQIKEESSESMTLQFDDWYEQTLKHLESIFISLEDLFKISYSVKNEIYRQLIAYRKNQR
jgi:hypothetical protein